jgi:hypothetical protein
MSLAVFELDRVGTGDILFDASFDLDAAHASTARLGVLFIG